ncbi:peptidase M61 [Zhouia sp. PK063]|uniref:M61 family metallopeptidase n=1 Tax=Zhouia sp. PK063 TaxID=3373602 RepID=UPI0037ADE870
MKKYFLTTLAAAILASCGTKTPIKDSVTDVPVNADINLNNVQNDQVKVIVNPGRFTTNSVIFHIPKTVPGTYSNDNYGQYIDSIVAYDYNNKAIPVVQKDTDSWVIDNATKLDKISYWVNDTFDSEAEKDEPVFSPAGTNIKKGENFFLNLHGFVGYFEGYDQQPYHLTIEHPADLKAATSLQKTDTLNTTSNKDEFYASRYFEVTDNPIMYSKPDQATFSVNGIQVTVSVYSPNHVYHASDIKDEMERMMKAQKTFLGNINSTKKYNVLLYLSDMSDTDASGFGALEHHTSTTVVLPETSPLDHLRQSMTDVVSHEFFHIVTPLSIHSEEIHYFNYNQPKMSEHLWMYEGVTEYFANLFQVNQGLINNQEFYNRMLGKIEHSHHYNDSLSFTKMSKNVLVEPYKDEYANVYEKGALIGMCLDIIIRDHSKGEKGILWLMKQLSAEYGQNKPFKDEELIPKIVSLTYPEVGEFLNTYVVGTTPIPYENYLKRVGLKFGETTTATDYFFDGEIPYIDANPDTNELFVRDTPLNSFFKDLGAQANDTIISVNDTKYDLTNARNLILHSKIWSNGKEITMVIKRDGKEITLHTVAKKPTLTKQAIIEDDQATKAEKTLRNAWLKN